MIYRSAENKFLVISAFVVLLLGYKTVASILEDPVVPLNQGLERYPASSMALIAPPQSLLPGIKTAAANLDFNCLKEDNKELVVKGSFLQIHGKSCSNNSKDGQISIINKSNGYTASVFSLNQNDFQTDLIQLVEGSNQILIQFEGSHGKKIERYVLVKASHL